MVALPSPLGRPIFSRMPTEEDLSPERALERAKISDAPGRPRGNAAWAKAEIEAGRQVRKVIWPPGPHVLLPGDDGLCFVDDKGVVVGVSLASIFKGDETDDDLWEHHPPAPAVPTMHAPILWILVLFPKLGGPELLGTLIAALESGHGTFTEHLLQIWRVAGDPETGRRIVAALGKIDRAVFHRSLFGDVRTSLEILKAVSEARGGRP
jgi:hypothetical protein